MNQPTHRRAEGRIPVHQRVINTVKTAATVTVAVLRSIAEMFVPSMQPSFAGMTPTVDNATRRTDDAGGFAGTTTPLTTTIASAMNRLRRHDTGNLTATTAHSFHRADVGITAHDGTFGTGLDPSATFAVRQT